MEERQNTLNSFISDFQLTLPQNDINNSFFDYDIIQNDKPYDLSTLEIGKKIRCPKCISNNCTFKIDPYNYRIQSDCNKNHHCDMDLADFIKESNKHQDENIKCNNEKCKNNSNIEYCYCGEIKCENCMKDHIKICTEEKKGIHNSIKFAEKDEKCCCFKEYNKFWFFCQNCQKNLCMNCKGEHSNHKTFKQAEGLPKDELEEIKKKLDIQKRNYEKIIEKIDSFFEKLKSKIELLKLHLKLFMSINELVYSSYDKKKINHEMISNLKNINCNFYDGLIDFINIKNFNEECLVLLNILEYQNTKDRRSSSVYSKASSINFDKDIKICHNFNQEIIQFKLEEQITSFCEMTKKNLLAFGVISGKIYLYENNNNYQKADIDIINEKKNEKKPILYLYELNNGNLLACTEIYFIIYNINLGKNSKFEEVQTFNYNNKKTSMPKVLEIFNENLLSIDGKELVLWRINLNNNQYDEKKSIKINNIICELLETDNGQIFVYTENKQIKIFDSNLELIDSIKDNNQNEINDIIKIEKLSNDIIMFVEKKNFRFFSLLNNRFERRMNVSDSYIIEGICLLNEFRNKFYVYFSKAKNNDVSWILQEEYSAIKGIKLNDIGKEKKLDEKIGFINKLNNGSLLVKYKEDVIKIYEDNKQNQNDV